MHARADSAVPPVEAGSARYFAWLYAGAARREPLELLLTIEREIETSLRAGLEHHVAHLRLEWWREECARFARGTPVHPATRRLRELAGDRAATFDLRGLVDAAAWDLAAAPGDTRAELEGVCDRWARAMIVPFALAGAHAPQGSVETETALRRAGRALREMEQLRALASDARIGRLRLPLDELDALGVAPRALATPPWPEPLNQHLRARFAALRRACADAWGTLDSSLRASLPGLAAWCAVEAASSGRAAARLPQPWQERRRHALSNAVRAWRAARSAHRGQARIA
jgi:phytoene/squalene synthetase